MLNLTKNAATPEQLERGIVDFPSRIRIYLEELLSVEDEKSLEDRCADIALLAVHNELGGEFEDPCFFTALIDGTPAMMEELEKALLDQGIEAVRT